MKELKLRAVMHELREIKRDLLLSGSLVGTGNIIQYIGVVRSGLILTSQLIFVKRKLQLHFSSKSEKPN